MDTAAATSNSLSTSTTSSSSTLSMSTPLPACPVLETTTTTSNTIPVTSQDAKETSKPRRKKRPPKNTSDTIKPKIEIKILIDLENQHLLSTQRMRRIGWYMTWRMSLSRIQSVLNMGGYTYKRELKNQQLKDSSFSEIESLSILSKDVERHLLKSSFYPTEGLLRVHFHYNFSSTICKNDLFTEHLRHLILEVINNILTIAVKPYTDGRKINELAGSDIYIETPRRQLTFRRRNLDSCSSEVN
ncbi:hypothetical protein TNCV_2059201 [Trichonephila clavipes]|nr:hypothetical protein TNCV_2059201 [Trichonephila clavipes]